MRNCGVITVNIQPLKHPASDRTPSAERTQLRGAKEPDAQPLSRPRAVRRRPCAFRGIVGRFVERRWHRSPCHVLYYINNTGVKTCA